MKETTNTELWVTIQKRANEQQISISELCRIAGVSRTWFERFKKHTPKSVEAYLQIDNSLKTLENENRDKTGKA
ncbi:hypothetical protein LJB95_00880 [Paludibacteraceae bacterium OttesenSCG-928-F17]|nr:hypothetical protein [Paludibacteraceae bacterium OttesenSCG-928-F17]